MPKKPQGYRNDSPLLVPRAKPGAPADTTPKAADPAEVADYCVKNGAAMMAADLIREGATMDEVREAVGVAAKIRGMVADARRLSPEIDPKLAEQFIAARTDLEDVRKAIFDQLIAAQSPEIRNCITADSDNAETRTQRGFDKAIRAVNARIDASSISSPEKTP